MVAARLIVIIDFEEEPVAVDFERPKVVFFVWVVGMTEIIIDGNCLHDPRDRLAPKAATPAVIKAVPVAKFWRSSSLSARMASVLVVIVVS